MLLDRATTRRANRERHREEVRQEREGGHVRRQRCGQKGERGQSLVIFVLSFTVLLAMVGLAIDATRAFDLYARMQRAAEAGVLAGVLYMPAYFNAVRPGDTDSAVSRAMKEIIKNGFGAPLAPTATGTCPTSIAAIEIAICPVTGRINDLAVTITERMDLALLAGLGVTPITLTATAQAEYLPPVQLGSRANYFGDQVECSSSGSANDGGPCSISSGGNHLQYFLATLDGPAALKESGDPMVYCAAGPAIPDSTQSNVAFVNGEDP